MLKTATPKEALTVAQEATQAELENLLAGSRAGLPMSRSGRLRPRPLRRREALAWFLFVTPWLIALVMFHLYPILAATYLSLTDYTVLTPPEWSGLLTATSS